MDGVMAYRKIECLTCRRETEAAERRLESAELELSEWILRRTRKGRL